MKKIHAAFIMFLVIVAVMLQLWSCSVLNDPHKVLGVAKDATQQEITKSFYRLSLKHHPDKNKSEGAQETFILITEAYEILSTNKQKVSVSEDTTDEVVSCHPSGSGNSLPAPRFWLNNSIEKYCQSNLLAY